MDTNSISNKKAQLTVIFFTVFIYLVGFGIIIPVIPILSRDFGATALQTGLLLSCYSLMQFLFAPFWGRLSDRLGRRPILTFCLLGEAASYLLFAWARSLEMLFVARFLAGFFGASISTASAYISDITPPNERSKGMALIGVAFGLGFVVGPALGGGLALWGQQISAEKHFDTSFAALWVAGLCLATFIFAFKFLKESLSENCPRAEKRHRLSLMWKYLSSRTVGSLMTVFLIASLAMSAMEATLILFMGEKFNWDVKQVSFGFAYIGVIIIFTQGFLVRRLLPLWGERKVLRLGLLLFAVGLTTIALANNLGMMALAMTLLSLGNGLSNPSILGSISLLTKSNEQGAALGVTQSMASLGRIIGPALGGAVYAQVAMTAPFWVSGGMAFIALAIVLLNYKKLPELGKTPTVVSDKPAVEVSYLGFFQFDNLIKNRVQFLLLDLGADITDWYKGMLATHLENYRLITNEKEAVALVEAKQLPKHFPIVVLCPNGKSSSKVAHILEEMGYTSVFAVEGGVKGLNKERTGIFL